MHPLILVATLLSALHPVATPALRAAPGPQHHVALAAGATGFFAAWEHKSGPAAGSGDVVGTRVTAEGTVLDGNGGIPVQPSWVSDTSPGAVWNGESYVVVYTRGPQPWPYGLEAVEVSVSGAIVIDREFVAPRDVQLVDVAWNGDKYLVVWVQDLDDPRAILLDRNLTPIGDEIHFAKEAAVDEIAVTSNGGSTFGVAWRTRDSAWFALVHDDGIAGPSTNLTGAVSGIDVASNGADYVVYAGNRLMMPGGLQVPMPEGSGQTIAWDGSHYVAAWSANDRVWSAELDASLHVTREGSRVTAYESVQRDPAIAGNLIAWEDAPPDQPYFTDIAASFIGGTRFLLSTSLADQRPGDAIWANGNLAMLWHEGDGAAASLRFGRMNRFGELLDGEGVALRPALSAKLAWNGSVFAVLSYRDDRYVELELLDAEGRPLGEALRLGTASLPRIASNGTDFLIAYNEGGVNVARRLFANGTLAEPHALPFLLGPGASRVVSAIVWTGAEYRVVQREVIGKYGGTYAVTSTLVSAAAEIGELHTIVRGDGIGGAANPFATWNGREIFYVWNLGNKVFTQRDESGTPVLFATDAFAEFAGFDGAQVVIVLGYGNGTRELVRGSDRTPLDMTPWTVFAAGESRVAIMEMRAIEKIPNLHDLDVWRASVRFTSGMRRRAI